MHAYHFISNFTAFVSPTLLSIGVNHRSMSYVWALSPIIGFFVTPFLGSLSDRCHLRMGRRRPFIILLSIGVFIGLLLVPNGEYLGYYFGDYYEIINSTLSTNETINSNAPDEDINEMLKTEDSSHTWGIFFTVLGTVLLDFDADACQSPSRAFLIDVCLPEDHAKGLSTFTIMAGLGGAVGYSLGGILNFFLIFSRTFIILYYFHRYQLGRNKYRRDAGWTCARCFHSNHDHFRILRLGNNHQL